MAVQQSSLAIYGWLSIAAALATIALKSYAYWLTDSVGLLSDALESLINLVAAVIVLITLSIASRPPDDNHAYGHDKIEYFSSGAEGIMILLAAISIAYTAWERLSHPEPLQQLDVGIAISVFASLINLFVARVLIGVGRSRQSITLEADGKHLMTDVWTTIGILMGIGAIAVANHFETTLDWAKQLGMEGEISEIVDVLEEFAAADHITYHALRTRYAGARRFMSVHVLVPGDWTVQQGHDYVELIEQAIMDRLDSIDIDTHLEPIEDLASWRH
jgi:divalent metal cation (Fe/Co/Zn/Cd) transporter